MICVINYFNLKVGLFSIFHLFVCFKKNLELKLLKLQSCLSLFEARAICIARL